MSGKNALILLGFRASPVKAQWFTSQQWQDGAGIQSRALDGEKMHEIQCIRRPK
jgi:hypothetical protein